MRLSSIAFLGRIWVLDQTWQSQLLGRAAIDRAIQESRLKKNRRRLLRKKR